MSVTANTSVRFREFNGWTDAALPIGWWWGETLTIGDLSGGTIIARVDFNISPPIGGYFGNFLSLEQVVVRSTRLGATSVRLRTQNLDVQENNPEWLGNLAQFPGGTPLALDPETLNAWRGLWLGRQRFRGSTTFIAVDTINDEDGAVFQFFPQGYMWSPRSAQAEGGPQRPSLGGYRA